MQGVKQVAERSLEAFRAGDVETFAGLYKPDAEIVGPDGAAMRGREGGRQLFELLRQRFAELEMTIDRETTAGSRVILEGTFAFRPTPHTTMPIDEMTSEPGGRVSGRYAQTFTVEGTLIRSHSLFFEDPYAGVPPWEIEGPQPALVRLAESGAIRGRVLDAGCGTGENTLFLAGLGLTVVGMDILRLAVEKAHVKAAERGLRVPFVVGDAREPPWRNESFDSIIDSGLLHVLFERGSRRLVAGARRVLRPAGYYHLMCLNERALIPGTRHLTQDEIRNIFDTGWRVESIQEAQFEVSGTGGWSAEHATAWLASVQRL